MLLLLLFINLAHSLRHRPFSKPINFPAVSSGAVQIEGSPGEGVSTFPVINIRFAYPPTSVDVRRRKALALSQAYLIDQSTKLSKIIGADTRSISSNIDMQLRIVQALSNAKSDAKYSKSEIKWLQYYAKYFPDVPSSFLEQDNPQINIGIEDNTGEFAQASEMNPREAQRFIVSISNEWFANRRLIIEILKSYLNRINILFEFLMPGIVSAKKNSFLETGNASNEKTSSPSTTSTGEQKGSTNDDSLNAPPTNGGAEFPFDMALMMAIRGRVMQGGRAGAAAITALIDLWNEQFGFRKLIRDSHVVADCKVLMSIPSTPDYIKNLAGSLISLISGMPVATSSADFMSGSYGHVNLVVPRPSRTYLSDKQIAFATGGDYSFQFRSIL